MKKLLFGWWVNKKQPKKTDETPTCGCTDKKLYDCDVFYPDKDKSIFMKLCINHVGEHCLSGNFVAM